LSMLRGIVGFVAGYLNDWVGQRVVTDMRNELTTHLQELDLAYFNRQRAGQIVSRVTADVTLVRSSVTDAVRSIFQDTTTLIGLVAGAFYMDWVLALVAVVVFPIAGLPLRLFSKSQRQNSRRQQEAAARLNAMLHENVQGNRIVKLFHQEGYEATRFHDQDERIFRLFMRSSRVRSLPITDLLAAPAIAGILWYGGARFMADPRAAGAQFAAFLAAVILLYEPFKKLVKTNYTIQQGIAGAERVFALMDVRSEIVDRPGAVTLRGLRDGVVFEGVWFEYEPGTPVLRDINLRIPVGKVVALVGMSGGGKSTLSDLIPRLYDVTHGRITIDGVDIREFTLESLRAHIAVVAQFTFLFNDTVRANIAYGARDAGMDAIVAAARAANAHDFIMALPRGYETGIGDLGVRLSGGQRQRLAIARAILKNAPFLILDEATSALDTESEGLVQEALERLMAHRTTLVVAHRLSTVRRADRIVVVSHGQIVESGTHEELLARGRDYWKLYELQFGEVEEAAAAPAAGG
ncbi:MAG TPA: ABC transporter ATP-binding protein, partial [Candidatus Binatia bacterium]|nr:ABC transporter ATP-binding protein [Candidatus Binatia bacterium]